MIDQAGSDPHFRTEAAADGALHDFNNALQALGAVLARAEARLAQGRASELPALLAAARDQLPRLSTLAGNVLGRAGSPRVAVPLPVTAFLRAMLPHLAALLDEGIDLDPALDAGTGTVVCDPTQLESAVRNLVLDARDAMAGRGTLTLSARVAAEPGGGFLEIAVGDTGCGMDPALLRRCTEPFVSTKANRSGTGLGLFQVRRFAEAAGGCLRLHSREGHGTTACIVLPSRDPGALPEAVVPRRSHPAL